jgi:hypothetical protein
LVTARQAADEEGVTRKRLATKQCQGSVSYGVGSQAIYREPCSSRMLSSCQEVIGCKLLVDMKRFNDGIIIGFSLVLESE